MNRKKIVKKEKREGEVFQLREKTLLIFINIVRQFQIYRIF